MATVQEVITASFKEINAVSSGLGTAEEYTDAFNALNRLLDTWATERLTIYTVARTTWTITANDNSYTVGASANINVARPVSPSAIDHVNFIDTSFSPDLEFPMQPLTEDAYANIIAKAQTSAYPTSWYYNPTYATGTLELYPVPTATTLTGALYAPTQVPQFAALSTSVSLPPGYERMIVKNLAIEICPMFEKTPNPLLVAQASDAKAAVKRANTRLMDMSFDAGGLISHGSTFDIRTG